MAPPIHHPGHLQWHSHHTISTLEGGMKLLHTWGIIPEPSRNLPEPRGKSNPFQFGHNRWHIKDKQKYTPLP